MKSMRFLEQLSDSKLFTAYHNVKGLFLIWLQRYWQDFAISIVLLAVGTASSFIRGSLIDPVAWASESSNLWFQADVQRVIDNMSIRYSDHYRTSVHPLYSLMTFPIVFFLRRVVQMDSLDAVRLFIAVVAGVWLMMLFVLLRLLKFRPLDGLLVCGLASISAASLFGFIIPDTYPMGSLTILVALCGAALSEGVMLPAFAYVGLSSFSLSVTTTNWMVGLLTTFIYLPWKRFYRITFDAFSIVLILWHLQKAIFFSAGSFLEFSKEKRFLFRPESGGPGNAFQAAIAHTMVMPTIQRVMIPSDNATLKLMTVQASAPGSASIWGAIAVGLWLALLCLGIWALFTLKSHHKFRLVLGFSLLGQVGLHLVYGEETFLYSLHFLPLLIAVAALSTLTRARLASLFLMALLTFTTGINNIQQFSQVQIIFQEIRQRYPNPTLYRMPQLLPKDKLN